MVGMHVRHFSGGSQIRFKRSGVGGYVSKVCDWVPEILWKHTSVESLLNLPLGG